MNNSNGSFGLKNIQEIEDSVNQISIKNDQNAENIFYLESSKNFDEIDHLFHIDFMRKMQDNLYRDDKRFLSILYYIICFWSRFFKIQIIPPIFIFNQINRIAKIMKSLSKRYLFL